MTHIYFLILIVFPICTLFSQEVQNTIELEKDTVDNSFIDNTDSLEYEFIKRYQNNSYTREIHEERIKYSSYSLSKLQRKYKNYRILKKSGVTLLLTGFCIPGGFVVYYTTSYPNQKKIQSTIFTCLTSTGFTTGLSLVFIMIGTNKEWEYYEHLHRRINSNTVSFYINPSSIGFLMQF